MVMRAQNPPDAYAEARPYRENDRLSWQGSRFEVVEVVQLTRDHTQVVLRSLERPSRFLLSVPESDLLDAVHIR